MPLDPGHGGGYAAGARSAGHAMPDIDAKRIRKLLRAGSTDPQAARARGLLHGELRRLRAAAGLRDRHAESRDGGLESLAAAFATGNQDLQALALLNARFASAVNLAMGEIAAVVHCTERTLRRLQSHGMAMLAARLAAPADARAPDPPTNLPRPEDAFVGRTADLAALERLATANAVVALCGPAGVGKTRLVVELSHRLHARFADGVWFVPLEHLDVPELLGPAVAGVVAAGSGSEPAPAEELLANRAALLILDRCEHLGPAVAALAADLTQRAPALRVLVTTRRAPGAEPHTCWPVAPLEVPPPGEARPGTVAGYAAAALFLKRLRAHRPEATLDAAAARDVADLVRRLDGMPLAIEVAAASAAHMPLALVAAQLAPSIARKTAFPSPVVDTPTSVRAAVEMGLAGLSRAEHDLLTRVAVFAGGFDLEMARAVCAATPDEREALPTTLAGLVRRALVVGEHVGAGQRFRLLEVMRAYAEDMLLRSGEADPVRRRHAEHLAAVALASHEALQGEDAETWATRLALEHANLQAARRWLLAHDPALALRAAAGLGQHWMMSGQLATGRMALEEALAAYERAGLDPAAPERQEALAALGAVARGQSDFRAARRALEAALALARQREDPRGLATALRRLGNVAEELGERDEATALYRESLAICEATGDRRGVALAHNNLGILADHEGRFAEAEAHHREALAVFEALGEAWHASVVRANLGLALSALGDHEAALATFRRALRTARELGDRVGILSNLLEMATSERIRGRPEPAWAHLGEALQLADDTGDRQKAVEWLESAAWLLVGRGQHAQAAAAFGAAEALRARWTVEVLPKAAVHLRELEETLARGLGEERARAVRAAAGTRRWQEVAAEVLAAGTMEARGD